MSRNAGRSRPVAGSGRGRTSLLAGLAAAAALAGAGATPLVRSWEGWTRDLRFQARGPRISDTRIVILEVNEETHRAWPEPMVAWGGRLARLVRAASAAGARRIALDWIPTKEGERFLVTPDPGPGEAGPDTELARAILENGYVTLARTEREAPHELLLAALGEPPEDLGLVTVGDPGEERFRSYRFYAEDDDGRLVPSLGAAVLARLAGRSPLDQVFLRVQAPDNGRVPVNFVGPPGAYPPRIAAHEIGSRLTEEQERLLRGSVVLIGTAGEPADRHLGPYPAPYDGVELHAHLLATVLDGKRLRVPDRWTEAAAALMFGLVAVLGFRRLELLAGLAAGAGATALSAAAAQLFFARGVMVPLASPLTALWGVYLVLGVTRAVEERRDRRRAEQLFGYYVDPRVAGELLAQPDLAGPGGAPRGISVLFADIRGFTAWSQSREPEQVVGRLNEYLREMAACVARHGGVLDKFIGDEVMAFWGAPAVQPDHAARALDCAQDLLRAVDVLNAAWAERGEAPFRLAVGISTGPAVVGSIGSDRRRNFTALGSTVNLAARLVGAAKEADEEIAVAAATFAALPADRPERERARPAALELKGFEGGQSAFFLGREPGP